MSRCERLSEAAKRRVLQELVQEVALNNLRSAGGARAQLSPQTHRI
jgi:hypothetical protein